MKEKMFEQIEHLADDIELVDNSSKREAFVLEFRSAVALMREDDFDQLLFVCRYYYAKNPSMTKPRPFYTFPKVYTKNCEPPVPPRVNIGGWG
jgi:hypothetical protein